MPDYKYYLFRYFCCCQTTKFKAYQTAIDKIQDDIKVQLNIISVFRRIRMHSFSLNHLLSYRKRKIIATLAYRRSVTVL